MLYPLYVIIKENIKMNNARDLFQLQSELIDAKIEAAARKTMDRLLQKIEDVKTEIRDLRFDMYKKNQDIRNEMHDSLLKINSRLMTIETKVGIISD